MISRRNYLKKEIANVCQRMDQKGFTANHDGNVTVKFDGQLLATPTSESKASISDELIITLDMNGKKLSGIGKPFSELQVHLACYNSRPDAKVVIHAHPPLSTARGLVGKEIRPSLPEAVVSIGEVIPVTRFCMPGASETEEVVSSALSIADIFLMPGNGVFTIGDDLEQAWLRLELVEHLCKIEYYAASVGENLILSEDQKRTLLEKRAKVGLGPQNRNIAPAYLDDNYCASEKNNFEELIASEITKTLMGDKL